MGDSAWLSCCVCVLCGGVRRSIDVGKSGKGIGTSSTSIHMKEPSPLQISSDENENGWGNDEDLDFWSVCCKQTQFLGDYVP